MVPYFKFENKSQYKEFGQKQMAQINITLPEEFNEELISAHLIGALWGNESLKNIYNIINSVNDIPNIKDKIRDMLNINAKITINILTYVQYSTKLEIIMMTDNYYVRLTGFTGNTLSCSIMQHHMGLKLYSWDIFLVFLDIAHGELYIYPAHVRADKITAYYAQLINPDVIIPDLWNLIVGFLFFII